LRVQARKRLIPQVAAVLRQYDAAALMAKCEAVGLPYAPIARPADLLDDPHLNHGGMAEVDLPQGGRTRLPLLPLELDGRRATCGGQVPRCGADTRAVLAELGLAPEAIERMLAERVVAGE